MSGSKASEVSNDLNNKLSEKTPLEDAAKCVTDKSESNAGTEGSEEAGIVGKGQQPRQTDEKKDHSVEASCKPEVSISKDPPDKTTQPKEDDSERPHTVGSDTPSLPSEENSVNDKSHVADSVVSTANHETVDGNVLSDTAAESKTVLAGDEASSAQKGKPKSAPSITLVTKPSTGAGGEDTEEGKTMPNVICNGVDGNSTGNDEEKSLMLTSKPVHGEELGGGNVKGHHTDNGRISSEESNCADKLETSGGSLKDNGSKQDGLPQVAELPGAVVSGAEKGGVANLVTSAEGRLEEPDENLKLNSQSKDSEDTNGKDNIQESKIKGTGQLKSTTSKESEDKASKEPHGNVQNKESEETQNRTLEEASDRPLGSSDRTSEDPEQNTQPKCDSDDKHVNITSGKSTAGCSSKAEAASPEKQEGKEEKCLDVEKQKDPPEPVKDIENVECKDDIKVGKSVANISQESEPGGEAETKPNKQGSEQLSDEKSLINEEENSKKKAPDKEKEAGDENRTLDEDKEALNKDYEQGNEKGDIQKQGKDKGDNQQGEETKALDKEPEGNEDKNNQGKEIGDNQQEKGKDKGDNQEKDKDMGDNQQEKNEDKRDNQEEEDKGKIDKEQEKDQNKGDNEEEEEKRDQDKAPPDGDNAGDNTHASSPQPPRKLKRSAPGAGSGDDPQDATGPDGKRARQAARVVRTRGGRNAAARGRAAIQASAVTGSDESEDSEAQGNGSGSRGRRGRGRGGRSFRGRGRKVAKVSSRTALPQDMMRLWRKEPRKRSPTRAARRSVGRKSRPPRKAGVRPRPR
ncbi:hypothetical protein EGW08_015561 [Elysia chlorotica]|uniref:Uncharacterized protein n=1 Tax=Elysia chlorotica TaxID=188477 RepID=A0A3S1B5P4_ELYCH|nr:hypothetical protein EGW08_015561 [Elysia chlorotica]